MWLEYTLSYEWFVRSQKQGSKNSSLPSQFSFITFLKAVVSWNLWVTGYKWDLGLLGEISVCTGSQLSFLKALCDLYPSVRKPRLGPQAVQSWAELDPRLGGMVVIGQGLWGKIDTGRIHDLSGSQMARRSTVDELSLSSLEAETIICDLKLTRIPLSGLRGSCCPLVPTLPGSGRSPGKGNGNPLQYSCLENSMDRGAWWATVHGIEKSWTRLSD